MIEDILISEEIIKEQFVCDLNACKGACCIEGDFGAPLDDNEALIIEDILEEVLPYLNLKSQESIRKQGFFVENVNKDGLETALMPDGACVFMGRNEMGITFCGIEKAFRAGKTTYKKPISCHLYPIRVTKNTKSGFQALNYDRWDICQAACTKGRREKVKIYEFAKEALDRAYGSEFYEQLSAADRDLQ